MNDTRITKLNWDKQGLCSVTSPTFYSESSHWREESNQLPCPFWISPILFLYYVKLDMCYEHKSD